MSSKLLTPTAMFTAIRMFTAISVMGTGTLPALAQSARPAAASSNQPQPALESPSTSPNIQYDCYDNRGNIAFTTLNPQDTAGWIMGCREVPFVNNQPPIAQANYYRCFDANGNIALTTVDEEAAERLNHAKTFQCTKVGHRSSSPAQQYSVYYECFNTQGDVAFTTRYPQDTVGWKPGCREIVTRNSVLSQEETPQPTP